MNKLRYEPYELKILRYLNTRMYLSIKEKNYYLNLEKGFKGEQNFDIWLENLSNDFLILNDLLLESNNSLFQIDSLLIFQETIYLFEVKNYEGDFYIEGDRWYTISRTEIKNPLLQLKRSEILMRKLLQELGFVSSIESYLIFINPEFNLYQAPLNLPIIFPTQLNRFMNKINMNSSKLKARHLKFVKQLLSINVKETPFLKLPSYTFDQLEKGITCSICNSFIADFKGGKLICSNCGCKEDVTSAVLRNLMEFNILFPDRKITTNAIYEWCSVIKSKKTIRKILLKKLKPMGHGKYTYYVSS